MEWDAGGKCRNANIWYTYSVEPLGAWKIALHLHLFIMLEDIDAGVISDTNWKNLNYQWKTIIVLKKSWQPLIYMWNLIWNVLHASFALQKSMFVLMFSSVKAKPPGGTWQLTARAHMFVCVFFICLLTSALDFCNRCFGKWSPVRYLLKDWKVYRWPGLWWRKMRYSTVC